MNAKKLFKLTLLSVMAFSSISYSSLEAGGGRQQNSMNQMQRGGNQQQMMGRNQGNRGQQQQMGGRNQMQQGNQNPWADAATGLMIELRNQRREKVGCNPLSPQQEAREQAKYMAMNPGQFQNAVASYLRKPDMQLRQDLEKGGQCSTEGPQNSRSRGFSGGRGSQSPQSFDGPQGPRHGFGPGLQSGFAGGRGSQAPRGYNGPQQGFGPGPQQDGFTGGRGSQAPRGYNGSQHGFGPGPQQQMQMGGNYGGRPQMGYGNGPAR